MGNYVFRVEALREALEDEAADENSRHDFGKDIIPRMMGGGYKVAIYDFALNEIPGEPDGAEPYWRDVGTVDSYFDANMDVRAPLPTLNLYNFRWHIRTAQRNFPPARFVRHAGAEHAGVLIDSLVCEGTIICSANLKEVVSGYDCYFHAYSDVEDSVILSGCDIGARSRLNGVLLDKNCSIAPGVVMGEDPDEDRNRFPFITKRGRIVLPKGSHVPRKGPIEMAQDIEALLRLDPSTAELMRNFVGNYTVSEYDRHSHDSVGPRFRRFGPGRID
jgi:glucose-1-phosphate adenylyltransferase